MPNISPRLRILLGGALIIVVIAAVYWPVLDGDFLLDDNTLLTENSLVKAPNGLYQFWCTTNADDYWPVTNSSFWLEWRLWHANSIGYHVTNLILHLAAVLLLWAILQKLTIPGAFLAALLFAVHPINVESVAWIAQRKNTLAIFFFLLSILFYVRQLDRPTPGGGRPGDTVISRAWYWFSLLAFVLAMLSKGSVVVLPLVLLLIVWWHRRRIRIPDLVSIAPFLLVAIALGIVNVWFQTHGAADAVRPVTFPQRLLGAGTAIWFYLAKACLPIDLLFVYPQWNLPSNQALWWIPLLAMIVVTVALIGIRHTRCGRPLLFAWAFFCITLAPVLGFVDVGFMQFSLVADHYQHIALIAVVATFAACCAQWRFSTIGLPRFASVVCPAAVFVVLAMLAWQRNDLFRSAVDLYTATLKANPHCWQLHNSLATVLNHLGEYPEAVDECQQALRLHPASADAHFNLAISLSKTDRTSESIEHFEQAAALRPDRAAEVHSAMASVLIAAGRFDEAIQHCRKSIQWNPQYADAYKNLGIAQLAAGQPASSVENFREALRLDASDGELLSNLGNALLATGQPQKAMECYQQALAQQFDSPELQCNLANLLVNSGEPEKALRHYEQALALRPIYPEAEGNWGSTLVRLGHPSEAIAHLEHALQLTPDSSDAHSNLGIALYSTGKHQEAADQFEEALRLNPKNLAAHFNLGIARAKDGQLEKAVDQFQQCLQLAPNNINVYAQLIAAYGELKQPGKAIEAIQKGLELARSTGRTSAVRQMEEWLRNLRAEQDDSPDAARSGAANPAP